ncbi:MAG: hypothetical protein IT514_02460, partial [Burkholderiales bacterium]|nr:hypothetical protein [Burkholderiales bacterium]
YTTPVAWVDSMLTDLAFLQRFYTSPDPWAELPALAASLRREHALARRLGWTMMRPLAD